MAGSRETLTAEANKASVSSPLTCTSPFQGPGRNLAVGSNAAMCTGKSYPSRPVTAILRKACSPWLASGILDFRRVPTIP